MAKQTIVMKFGGASVKTPQHFQDIARRIKEVKAEQHSIIVVVSAMGNTTDQLISLAREVHPDPPRREYDMLVTVGERISISLLAMALAKLNIPATSFTGSQSGIITTADHSNAQIIDVRPNRLEACLNDGKIAIVAGFQGMSIEREITTLGRGGSDTTAVALGVALGAQKVEFFKDVEGIYDLDPKKSENAILYSELTYEESLKVINMTGNVLHPRCIKLAMKNQIPLRVRSFQCETLGTLIRGDKKESFCKEYEENPFI